MAFDRARFKAPKIAPSRVAHPVTGLPTATGLCTVSAASDQIPPAIFPRTRSRNILLARAAQRIFGALSENRRKSIIVEPHTPEGLSFPSNSTRLGGYEFTDI